MPGVLLLPPPPPLHVGLLGHQRSEVTEVIVLQVEPPPHQLRYDVLIAPCVHVQAGLLHVSVCLSVFRIGL